MDKSFSYICKDFLSLIPDIFGGLFSGVYVLFPN